MQKGNFVLRGMNGLRKVKSVRTLQNEKGYTLIESLLSLIIFMVIISITTSSLSAFVKRNHKQGSLNHLEWDNFI
ncbi:type II secretion system protein, partial [Bacillus sp. JJ664]